MALSAHGLTIVPTVKSELSLSTSEHDGYIERLINVYSERIERYCDRHFERATVTETHPAEQALRLILRRTPVVSVTSIAYDGTAVDSTSYEIEDTEAGFVRFICQTMSARMSSEGIAPAPVTSTSRRLYSVVYVGGYVLPKDDSAGTPRTLPYDLEEACVLAVASAYRRRGADRAIESESLLDYSVSYANGGDTLPGDVRAMLEPFRRWFV